MYIQNVNTHLIGFSLVFIPISLPVTRIKFGQNVRGSGWLFGDKYSHVDLRFI